MKVVCCKNCGAKYQLDDNDDISSYECSSCAGELEVIENYPTGQFSSNQGILSSIQQTSSEVVQCEDCGLKFKIKSSDNILDYECDSCGGSLRYLDDERNRELDKYIDQRRKEHSYLMKTQPNFSQVSEDTTDNDRSIKSLTNRLESFFSEDEMQKIAEEELEEERIRKGIAPQTARTSIPQPVLSKFGKEFAIPNTDDYYILKNFLKDEFFKGVSRYYPETVEQSGSDNRLGGIRGIVSSNPGDKIVSADRLNSESDEFDIRNLTSDQTIEIIGVVILALSSIEIILLGNIIGYITLFIGAIIIIYGLLKTHDRQETTERTRIIREHLLTLPQEYYVFYNVKTPTSPTGINHVVVGPTGIYALLSKKYNPKNRLNADNENELIKSTNLDDDKFVIENYGNRRRFRYTTKQAKFSQDNAIKQKSLTLGEDLINFLNENNIKNCFVEPLVGFINEDVVVINMPLTDEDLFIEELLNTIQMGTIKLSSETIDKCAVLLSRYSADCSSEI